MPPNMYPGAPQRRFNFLVIPFALTVLGLIGVLIFAIWAFGGMQDYKKNAQTKIDAAVTVAKEQTATEKDKEFNEKEKSPSKEYKGPATYGSVSFQYPKTWSAYINETSVGALPIDGFFHPNFVPGLQSGTALALRVQVTNQPYATEMLQYETQATTGKVSITPFRAALVNSALGARIDGEVIAGQKDSFVVLPLRDKTLKIWTESTQFTADFDNIVLPSLSFVP